MTESLSAGRDLTVSGKVKRRRIPVMINGVQYPSVSEACQSLECSIPSYTVRARLRRGESLQSIVKEENTWNKRSKEIAINGVTFPSLIEAYRSLKPKGSYPMICRWIRDGMDPAEAFKRLPMRKGRPKSLPSPSCRGFTMNGVLYASCADAYRRLKPPVSYGTIQKRIREGMSRLKAFSLPRQPEMGKGHGKRPSTR